VAVLLVLTGLRVDAHVLWAPVLIMALAVLVFGITALLSVANLFFRDVKYIVEVIVTFAIFFTPVFYEASDFGKWQRLILLNPVAPLLEGLTAAVVHGRTPPLAWIAYSTVLGFVLAYAALRAFARMEPRFAENI
jgi:lipopolysaccharide transport system permease protein